MRGIMIKDTLYQDDKFIIYMWRNWILVGRPIQIYFCRADEKCWIDNNCFNINEGKALKFNAGEPSVNIDEINQVIGIINNNGLVDKAIKHYEEIKRTCVYE